MKLNFIRLTPVFLLAFFLSFVFFNNCSEVDFLEIPQADDDYDPAKGLDDETDPIETDPIETDPIETDPIETDPIETDPIETDPIESTTPTIPTATTQLPCRVNCSDTGIYGQHCCIYTPYTMSGSFTDYDACLADLSNGPHPQSNCLSENKTRPGNYTYLGGFCVPQIPMPVEAQHDYLYAPALQEHLDNGHTLFYETACIWSVYEPPQ